MSKIAVMQTNGIKLFAVKSPVSVARHSHHEALRVAYPTEGTFRWVFDNDKAKLDFQVENQPRAAYISRTALVCVEECVHSVMFLKKQLQA